MNQNNPETKPVISDPSKTTITQPVHQPVQPAKMPNAAPLKDIVNQPTQQPAKRPDAAPLKNAVKTTP